MVSHVYENTRNKYFDRLERPVSRVSRYRVLKDTAKSGSGFDVYEQVRWPSSIKQIRLASHPSLFTAGKYYKIKAEMEAEMEIKE